MNAGHRFIAATAVCLAALAAERSGAQVAAHATARLSVNVVVPQMRAFSVAGRDGAVEVTDVKAGVAILEQVATTTLDIGLRNPGRGRQEAELIIPVPEGAVIRGFTFEGMAAEPRMEILPKEKAREVYSAIVARIKDPALLEFAGYNAIRSSVFPVEAGKTQKVRLTYERLLAAEANRVDYELPRSETMGLEVPWEATVVIKSTTPISTVYSPTHELHTVRHGPGRVSVSLGADGPVEPGPLRLSYLLEREGLAASLLAYPDPKLDGGYFLVLAGLPAEIPGKETIKREVTLVFDRSGSMNGEKMRQVRAAALQVLGGLEDGEAFNIMAYNEAVDPFSRQPVIKSRKSMAAARRFLKGINPRGGTNIHDALVEALRQKPTPGMLPIVLFLTDGIPTIGRTSEKEIGRLAEEGNPHGRRVFTFGVGVDVNAPLLDRVAAATRATAAYVLPDEDVEVKVAGVFERLGGPILADPQLRVVTQRGEPAMGRVRDLLPSRLPDLFTGDQLVLLGQYSGNEPLRLQVTGNYLGKARTFTFAFELDKATTRNAFVPRLWAARKIAVLIDAVRQLGADRNATFAARAPLEPKLKELTDEIVRLSVEFGILTEYTAFLAREGTDLSRRDDVLAEVERNLQTRAMGRRSGWGAVNQSVNNDYQARQKVLNKSNAYLDENMNRVQISRVRQINDLAFYQRGNRWIDSRVALKGDATRPDRVIEIGSPEFLELAGRMAQRSRQGALSFKGEILLDVDGETVLCR